MKAGVLAVAAFALLVPTFNALNAAHFDDMTPPFELKPPDDHPDVNLQPREDPNGVPVEVPAGLDGCHEMTVERKDAYNHTFGSATGLSLASPKEEDHPTIDVPPGTQSLGVAVAFKAYKGSFHLYLKGVGGSPGYGLNVEPADDPGLRDGTWTQPVTEPRPGKWTIDWDATTITGGGGIGMSLFTPKCADTPPTPNAPGGRA